MTGTVTILVLPSLSRKTVSVPGLSRHMAVFEIVGVRKGFTTTESAWMVGLALALTWLVAELSYRYIERPISLRAARTNKLSGVDDEVRPSNLRISGEPSQNAASQHAVAERAAQLQTDTKVAGTLRVPFAANHPNANRV